MKSFKMLLTLSTWLMVTLFCGNVLASPPEIVKATVEHGDSGWTFHVTLKHPDTGWKHYADGWRVVTRDGKVLGKRTLYHPHEEEQPFTRSLAGVKIPAKVSEVFIEAHCKVTGWGKQRYAVKLR